MSILIVPYNGESAELTKVLKEYNVTIPKKKECKGGSCPIPKPLKMMSAAEVENSIANAIKNVTNVKQITVLAMNDKDQLSNVHNHEDRQGSIIRPGRVWTCLLVHVP